VTLFTAYVVHGDQEIP